MPPPPPGLLDLYVPMLLGLGLLTLLVAWAPLFIKRAPLSLPILCVGIGAAVFSFDRIAPYALHPLEGPELVEHAAELIVIVSLMGAGLKIDRALKWQNWAITTRLMVIAMPLSIAAFWWAGLSLLGLGAATALLLAASLAPTDPVLASDVQIEDPQSAQDDEARFALTSEAGLNDSFAFPFVHLAILAAAGGWGAQMWQEWALDPVLTRLSVGAAAGIAGGWLVGHVIYGLRDENRLARTGDGFVALGVTLAIYALTELLHGYGFFAVFLAGLMIRRAARDHDFNDRMHNFADESERLLMMVLLFMFGGMLTAGGLFTLVGWPEVAFAALAIFVIRPLAGWIALLGVARPPLERFVVAFFGIRGLGSIYYLAYGLNHARFEEPNRVWGAAGLVILVSILLHGVSVTPLMRRLDRQRGVPLA
ncbi:cation:proton antiporter [Sphingomonas qomolangmaensis]|uniref:Cation:proton antiporter n=1 Tax=Sphingomonas qomolangmaensis TaxID=2918765 RepID=A0ABY5L5E5_9SPHN|nr:cation:proton antiporter [Sphingomonas qomolangmaensis]UUL82002.1 cation:proton antiporter [Sphingomonas qomolangmaensis]